MTKHKYYSCRTPCRHSSIQTRFLSLYFSLYLLCLPLILADELPLSDFPLFHQASQWYGVCASSYSSIFSTSFGCDPVSPAACLCTDAAKSLKIASNIRSCAYVLAADASTEPRTATSLWASYCLTNAGVSARDETLLEDMPFFTQVGSWVREIAAEQTSSYIITYGCSEYTKVPCLCGNSASSFAIQEAIKTGISQGFQSDSDALMTSGSALFSSFCAINLKQPAVRSIGKPVSVSGAPPNWGFDGLLDNANLP